MVKVTGDESLVDRGDEWELPQPTQEFRRRAWREFERALDPLAWPRPLPRKLPP
ncbi:MAG TPA: hypothetical protein VFM96_12545 [Gaiellaceae bacterium]|nr:hypothetical protein [Gaiellaceae bacterium]